MIAGAVSAASLDDSFDGNALDWCHWEDTSYQAAVSQSGQLVLAPDASGAYSSARVHSQARLVGDFDVQVDYQLGAGLDTPVTSGQQLDVTLGIYWDEARAIFLGWTRQSGGAGIFVYASLPELAPNNSLYVPDAAQAGTLRIVRSGTTFHYYQRPSGSGTWNDIGTMNGAPATPVHVTLSAYHVNVARAFTASFDNFQVTAGTSDDIDYVQPTWFRRPADFGVAAFVENYPVQRYWRHKWGAKDFFDYAKEAGFDWAKTSVTMLSAPELAATPASQWDTLAWQDTFWSSREYAAETMKQAKARGLRQEVQLLLSPHAAYWGYQEGPTDWLSKTPDEIVPLLTQNVYDTVMYFKNQGLNVEKWAIGNEVDVGVLDFLPNDRISVPPGVGYTTDMQWMRDNVWPIEAKLLKAAAAGVAQADPSAKIILHIGGLEFSPGNVFVPAFFQAMHDFGVPFDYGALSHPYATYAWKLDHYPAACWFKRLALSFDRITAVTGKPAMMVEGDYPAAVTTGIISAPMPDFSFTPAGQAAWVHQQLRFAAGRPNIAGWHYFYPDMASDVIGTSVEEMPLAAMALFATSTAPRPALAEFHVNLSIFTTGFE
jgi:arabinogalactan endo-1,4-beta-galactosidase